MFRSNLINASGVTSLPASESQAGVVSQPSRYHRPIDSYAIIVANKTQKHVIAYVLRTKVTDESGRASIQERIFTNLRLLPDGGVIPNGNEIGPGLSRILIPTIAKSEDGLEPSQVTVSLDLLVFEDGEVLGADEGMLLGNLSAQLQVEQQFSLICSANTGVFSGSCARKRIPASHEQG